MTPTINPSDVKNMSESQETDALAQIKEADSNLQEVIKAFVEKRVADCLIKYNPGPDLHTVIVDANYEYNDEGYAPTNVMVWLNDHNESYYDDDRFSRFQEKVDASLEPVADMLRGSFEFDVGTLKDKYKIEEAKKAKKTVGKIGKRYNL